MRTELTRYSLLQQDQPIVLLWTIYEAMGLSSKVIKKWHSPSVNRDITFISRRIEFVRISTRHKDGVDIMRKGDQQTNKLLYIAHQQKRQKRLGFPWFSPVSWFSGHQERQVIRKIIQFYWYIINFTSQVWTGFREKGPVSQKWWFILSSQGNMM